MSDLYGSDFISIIDEDGTEYELEVLTTVEHNGFSYLAVLPANGPEECSDLQVSILKSVEEEDGEDILCAVEDENELEAVHQLIMDQLYADSEED